MDLIKEINNDPSLTWCFVLIKCLNVTGNISSVEIVYKQDENTIAVNCRLNEGYASSSSKFIRRISSEFANKNKSYLKNLIITDDKIEFVFQKTERAKVVRKENPLKDGKLR